MSNALAAKIAEKFPYRNSDSLLKNFPIEVDGRVVRIVKARNSLAAINAAFDISAAMKKKAVVFWPNRKVCKLVVGF
ncbi:MAG: hypothetical protein PHN89_03960 [Candidatus Pacebacteria bacterium]|nr:hypothetical protein [Candidatus Paceibacterota bacterium]